ncbi:MAG: fused DSP-PTPase phosphatase/NAD kinase-like protein [Planctomycetota bacterium]
MTRTMHRNLIIVCCLGVLLIASCNGSSPKGKANVIIRPAEWSAPIEGLPGLPNLHKVDDGLYRGAQPEEEGFAGLKKLGIKTVVNLRSLHSDRSECKKHGLDYVKISAQAWEAEEDEVVDFMKIATDPERMPVFVHCQHGADRTGMMVAVYRVVEMGWTKEEAIREMTEGGYGYHSIWKGLLTYIRELDVPALKAKIRGE